MSPVIGHVPSGASVLESSNTSTAAEGTTITASATPHANGTWQQIIASTAYDSYGITVIVAGTATASANTRAMLSIGVGAAASEQVLIPKLLCGNINTLVAASGNGVAYHFPLFIPAGTRLSGQLQAVVVSETVTVQLILHQWPIGREFWVGSRVTAYGVSADPDPDSLGISHTPGSTNAYATATQIVASTTNPILAMQIGMGQASNASIVTTRGMVRIGIGSTPDYVAQHLPWKDSTTTESVDFNHANMVLAQMRFSIPAATRLVVSAMINGTGVARDWVIYGVD
jgi:hypothetical protein